MASEHKKSYTYDEFLALDFQDICAICFDTHGDGCSPALMSIELTPRITKDVCLDCFYELKKAHDEHIEAASEEEASAAEGDSQIPPKHIRR